MRVKLFTLIILAAMLIASAAYAVAGDLTVSTYMPKSLPNGIFAYPVYDGNSIKDLYQVNDLIGGTADLANDTYHSYASGLPPAENIKSMMLDDRINSLPDPMMLVSAMAPPVSADSPYGLGMDHIKNALIGTNLTYTNIAGKPMNYTITADSIKSIKPTAYKNKTAWKVRVGEGMAWDLIVDSSGKILETKQLFYT